jgi:hypothetical protein
MGFQGVDLMSPNDPLSERSASQRFICFSSLPTSQKPLAQATKGEKPTCEFDPVLSDENISYIWI